MCFFGHVGFGATFEGRYGSVLGPGLVAPGHSFRRDPGRLCADVCGREPPRIDVHGCLIWETDAADGERLMKGLATWPLAAAPPTSVAERRR